PVARFGVSAHEQKNEPAGGSYKDDRHLRILVNSLQWPASEGLIRSFIRSAILKTSQPRAAKLKPQKSMTMTIALTFLQDDCDLTARVQVTNC
ncbi:MAG TPA: hypothetical protein VGG86_09195, partial [Roseiarcus sp.]